MTSKQLGCPPDHPATAHACDEDIAECGCRFLHGGYDQPEWIPCRLHDAADDVLAALETVTDALAMATDIIVSLDPSTPGIPTFGAHLDSARQTIVNARKSQEGQS